MGEPQVYRSEAPVSSRGLLRIQQLTAREELLSLNMFFLQRHFCLVGRKNYFFHAAPVLESSQEPQLDFALASREEARDPFSQNQSRDLNYTLLIEDPGFFGSCGSVARPLPTVLPQDVSASPGGLPPAEPSHPA